VRRVAGFVAAAGLGSTILLAAVVSALRPEHAAWPLALGCAVALLGCALALRVAGARAAGPVLAVASLTLLLWPELGLRAVGYRNDGAGVLQFGYPRPDQMVELQRDPELFWRLSPELEGVNSQGFAGPEFAVPKRPGVERLVFLGDSCTQQGFPRGVAQMLNSAGANPRYDAVNLGVVGYTSHQGRIVAERWLAALEADVAVIYFGWNDHWQAYGQSDAERSGASSLMARAVSSSRFAQWLVGLRRPAEAAPLGRPRVPIEAYAANLNSIAERARSAGAQSLFVTAPSAHAEVGVPDYLVERGFASSAEQAVALHRAYNERVRALAREHGWALLDLAARAQTRSDVAELFMRDGIHFTPAGLRWIAQQIAERIASLERPR